MQTDENAVRTNIYKSRNFQGCDSKNLCKSRASSQERISPNAFCSSNTNVLIDLKQRKAKSF